jgi:hypothetical protein
MTPEEIARRRLAAQHLVDAPAANPAEVVRRLGAVQAQDYAGAKWAIALRSRSCVDAVVERAMTDGSIIRTHVLRPTWHFVAPEDVRWMLALTAPRIKAALASYDRKLGLDDAVFRRSNAAIERALRDGKQLTRAELAQALRRARIDVTGSQRLGHLVARAELDAIVCSGARRGKQFTYALLDERVPPTTRPERDEALLMLARRYFATRGPAATSDFAWWSGLRMADAKRAIELADSTLERTTVGDRSYWLDPTAPAAASARPRSPTAHLLPNYDEYFIGFKDRSAIGERLRSADLVTGGNALISYVVVVDGQLVGGWKRVSTNDAVAIDLTLLTPLSGAEHRAIERAAAAYETFLGMPVKVRTHRAPAGM